MNQMTDATYVDYQRFRHEVHIPESARKNLHPRILCVIPRVILHFCVQILDRDFIILLHADISVWRVLLIARKSARKSNTKPYCAKTKTTE
jgi:hypothetical protein